MASKKITAKEFKQKAEQLEQTQRVIRRNEELIRQGNNTLSTDFYLDFCRKLEANLKNWFDVLETVYVKAWIGSRRYYQQVIKLGKYYYLRNQKMTKSNGWHGITEINEITDKMTTEMMDDSYYY